MLYASKSHRERSEAQVCFGLSTSCRKPEQIDRFSVRRVGSYDAFKVQEEESNLKRSPHRRFPDINPTKSLLVIEGLDRSGPLKGHDPICELEGLQNLRILSDQFQSRPDPE